MYKSKAYSAASATSASGTHQHPASRSDRNTTCRSRFSSAASAIPTSTTRATSGAEVMPTVYPCVPGHEIVGRVTKVGSAVTKFKPGDLAAVGCLVDSDGTCPIARRVTSSSARIQTWTYGFPDKHLGSVTYGGYSESIVVDERFVLRVPAQPLAGRTPLLCFAPASPPTRRCATGKSPRARKSASWGSAGWATWA
jgi:uncharacterized zinc-type alcohol dehydrogenase-like protein